MDILQQPIILISLFALCGYLLGSISTAIVTCKLMGLADPRSTGSNNPGATNVLRVGGKKAAIITLLGDMLKGLLPVLLAHSMGMADNIIAITGLAAFLGHLYPVFYGFQGGKGVATLLGVLLGIHWILGLATIGVWILVAFISRYSSLSALVAALLAPLQAWLITDSWEISSAILLMSSLLYWRHRSNIQNLLHGREGKIGTKK